PLGGGGRGRRRHPPATLAVLSLPEASRPAPESRRRERARPRRRRPRWPGSSGSSLPGERQLAGGRVLLVWAVGPAPPGEPIRPGQARKAGLDRPSEGGRDVRGRAVERSIARDEGGEPFAEEPEEELADPLAQEQEVALGLPRPRGSCGPEQGADARRVVGEVREHGHHEEPGRDTRLG